ncbi:hypothetical protein [Actinokineospora pegani]|uniref:hypothetical protein n=1 Tax=Actinokineospora pegani TaxID=2654637 RepID=UPI0018D3A192|nr:hypothetical protein [Actinokineospora pegani]
MREEARKYAGPGGLSAEAAAYVANANNQQQQRDAKQAEEQVLKDLGVDRKVYEEKQQLAASQQTW